MKLYIILLVALLDLNLVLGDPAPEDVLEGVLDLNAQNMHEHLGTKHILLEFYAPWCGWCKNLVPVLSDLGKTLSQGGADDVAVAKFDATQDGSNDIKAKFEVHGFPTIVLVKKGEKDSFVKFNGERTVEGFMSFIKEHTSGADLDKIPVQTPPNSEEQVKHAVVELTPQNFDEVVLDASHDVFVKFYAPWCGHCQRMVGAWEEVGQAEPDVVIAKLDASAHPEIGARFGVRGFPTLKFFSKNDKTGQLTFKGARDTPSLRKFVDENRSHA